MTKLNVNDVAPQLGVLNQDGKEVKIENFLGEYIFYKNN